MPSEARGVGRRPHTGRRRNEAARQAVLAAAEQLVTRSANPLPTVEAIAAAAGVGKQTIYRWWPSKGALLLEVLTERATLQVPVPDTGSLRDDLEGFLEATFAATADPTTVALLRSLMAQSLQDASAAEVLRGFVAARRGVLRGLFARGQDRGELGRDADLDLLVDQVFGVVWYRLLVGHAPLTPAIGRRLAHALARSG